MFAAETNGILRHPARHGRLRKDVSIGNVFAVADPASCRVAAFKEPTPEEQLIISSALRPRHTWSRRAGDLRSLLLRASAVASSAR